MKNNIKFFLIFGWISFNVFLFILPNMLFTDSLSKSSVEEENLSIPENNLSMEQLILNASNININNEESGSNSQFTDKYVTEIQKILNLLNTSTDYLAILNQSMEVSSGTIYWLINYSTIDGYGEVLIEDKTNKIVQFKYYPEQGNPKIDPKIFISAYFKYLGVELTSIEEKNYVFEISFSDDEKVYAVVDEYRIIINYSIDS